MYKGLFFGLTTVDILYGVRKHPDSNEKMKADWQLAFAGGPAANAAVAFAALGNDSHLCSGLGRHATATLASADLAEHNVTFYDCCKESEAAPVLSSILINQSTGERCVVYSNTEDRHLSKQYDFEKILAGSSTVLLDGYYLEQASILAHAAHSRGVTVVLDGGSWKEGLECLLPCVDYAICSANFMPPGCCSVDDVLAFLSQYQVKGCAVSRGDASTLTWEAGKRGYLDVPVVNAVDTLGAGDILHGVFCHYINSESFGRSLEYAIKIASDSCCYYGTRQWISSLR